MTLDEAIKFVRRARRDAYLQDLFKRGDKARKTQTAHDEPHGRYVRDLAMQIATAYDAQFPGKLNDWGKQVVVPLAGYTHDIGSVNGADNHDIEGARLMNEYLKRHDVPPAIRKQICRIIALHRSEKVLAREFDDPAHAIVVIADKCVGDEDRVRPNIRRTLQRLRRENRMSRFKGSIHDRVNFAVKRCYLTVDPGDAPVGATGGAIVLKLDFDPKVASPEDMTNLYKRRYHAAGKAAKYLGFVFRMEFNGIRYAYDKASDSWKPVTTLEVPVL